MGGQCICERSSEVFVKIKKKTFFGGGRVRGGGVRVNVNKELNFFVKNQKQ